MKDKKEEPKVVKVTELDEKIIVIVDAFNKEKETHVVGAFDSDTISFFSGHTKSQELNRDYLKSLKEDKLNSIINQQLTTLTGK